MQTPPISFDRPWITQIAWQVLQTTDAEILSYGSSAIAYAGTGEDSRGLFLISGTAIVGPEQRDWSFVLKVFRALPDGSTSGESTPHYWKREELAYRSGLLDALPDGLAIPSCYCASETPDGALLLCLEHILPTLESPWPLSRLRLTAYHLGLFNGRYAAANPLPQHNWLSRDMTQTWAEENAYTVDLIERFPMSEVPALRMAFPTAIATPWLRLWDHRSACFRTLVNLPRTLCHHDAGHRNLFDRVDPEGRQATVLIDWELVGYGAIGEELGNLFGPALINFEVPAEEADVLFHTLLEGYIDGLQDAGWNGSQVEVRLAFLLSSLFRWGFAATGWPIAVATDESGKAEKQTRDQWGRPMEEVYSQWAGISYYLSGFIAEVLGQLRADGTAERNAFGAGRI